MSRYVETNARMKACPFCGINRQYITVDRPAGLRLYGMQAYLAQVHCHSCGATVEGINTDEEGAIRVACMKYISRAPALEKHPKPIRTQQGRARA